MITDLYDFPTSGRDSGHGTFTTGTVTKIQNGYHLTGSSERGINFGAYLDVVYVGYQEEPDMDCYDTFDVSETEFRLGDGELYLRNL